MVVILHDENNPGHHLPPSDLILPKSWSEEYTLPKFSAGCERILNVSSIESLTFLFSIAQSLERIRADATGNTLESPPVINRHFNVEECLKKIFLQSAATIYHFELCSKKEDWYEEMVDFIEYNCLTFGIPSTGFVQYLETVEFLIQRQDQNPKLTKLSEYIRIELSKDTKTRGNQILELFEMFDEWWESIPFSIEYLKPLQDRHYELLALLLSVGPKNDLEQNRYSGVKKVSVYTISQMSAVLCDLTNSIIKIVTRLTSKANLTLTDIKKHEVSLAIAERIKKSDIGYSKAAKENSPEYQEMWHAWLKDEQSFFSKLEMALSEVPTIRNPKTKQVIEELNRYDFENFLKKEGYDLAAIHNLIELHGGGVPYCIALLHELGYLKHFLNEFCATKKDMNQKLAEIFGSQERRIKGNINIIWNSNSSEDATQYTSINHQETVRKQLKGRK